MNAIETLTSPQKHQRLLELFEISRERYLSAGGDRHRACNGNEGMTPDEQQEFLAIARSLEHRFTNPDRRRS